ncbi:Nmad2 family putative nucleotide modification protein [Geovibrio ferrireducens]|uniref:Nmad2 family putative nucleotide modification protein n=1 Tax=Geovibrio ferrireducens TaxID=46201 RepID=UPI002245D568|nr:hypothetical protein [Geovibrio ferrireducens]
MKVFAYIVKRDYGFAPNPFFGYCTLATCKPEIRRLACIGDWILGNGSVNSECANKLIYCMRITNEITFNEYWSNPVYSDKKPDMNTSLKKMYGDNIYFHNSGIWYQADSHHSNEDGTVNNKNLEKDTSTDRVLISDNFFYFGEKGIAVPEHMQSEIICRNRGHKNVNPEAFLQFHKECLSQYTSGFYDAPEGFKKGFERYNGQ